MLLMEDIKIMTFSPNLEILENSLEFSPNFSILKSMIAKLLEHFSKQKLTIYNLGKIRNNPQNFVYFTV